MVEGVWGGSWSEKFLMSAKPRPCGGGEVGVWGGLGVSGVDGFRGGWVVLVGVVSGFGVFGVDCTVVLGCVVWVV